MAITLENNTTGLEELLSLANELSEAPVKSVNGKTGNVVLNPSDIGAAESFHSQAASTITAGTFAGAVVAQTSSQTPDVSLLRNSKLVTSETNPTNNGEICWMYE